MKAEALLSAVTAAFNAHAQEGIHAWRQSGTPVLRHICLKFSSLAAYAETIAEAAALGPVVTEEFNGKEIAWCKMKQPLESADNTVAWIEMVEPRLETNAFDGVTSIGYSVEGLTGVVKLPSKDAGVLYRYMGQSVHP